MKKPLIIFTFLFLLGFKLHAKLKEDIIELVSDEEAVSISILNPQTEEQLLAINSHQLLKPASNLKLIIGASILKGLGTRYRFLSKFYLDKDYNLIVKGSGDPSFTSKRLGLVLRALKRKKIPFINNIIGINSVFDRQRIGIMWSWDDLSKCYSAQISGLQINNNCVKIVIKPSKNLMPVNLSIIPFNTYISIKNYAITKRFPKTPLNIKRIRNTNVIELSGELALNAPKLLRYITVNKPSYYFLNLLRHKLLNIGIMVKGKDYLDYDIGYKLNRQAKLIAKVYSPYIKFLLRDFLQFSINLYGESFLKTLGYIFFNRGSTYNGRIAVKMLLRPYKLPKDEVFIADGSGLSELNLVSTNYLARLLSAIYNDSFYKTFKETLSVAGVSGTLKSTLNIPKLKGKIFAKTGHLQGVIALSGYAITKHKTLVFSIIFNKVKNKNKTEKLIQKILIRLLDT